MAPTATAEKEVTHQTTAGSLAGAGVVGGITGVTTAAVGTKIATDGIDFKSLFNKAQEASVNATETVKEKSQNINIGGTLANAQEKATDVASKAGEAIKNVVTNNKNLVPDEASSGLLNHLGEPLLSTKRAVEGNQGTILKPTTLQTAKETAKNFADDIKGKAGNVLTGLQNNAKELEVGFKALPPGKQAMVVIPAAIAFALAAKVTHDKLSRIEPETDNVAKISKGINARTTELEIPQSASR
jgi:hypothetical protein